jgi:RHS repeat-associated protein
VLRREYDPWGRSATGGGWAFTGRESDAETGLYYYRARYYDAAIGRFASQDPLWTPTTLYGYVGNRPMVNADPSGRIPSPRGCDTNQTTAFNTAVEKVRKCLATKHEWLRKLEETTFHCVSWFEQAAMGTPEVPAAPSGTCAEATGPPTRVKTWHDAILYEPAFDPPNPAEPNGPCGGLESTILHEIAHLMNQDEAGASKAERCCFSCGGGSGGK